MKTLHAHAFPQEQADRPSHNLDVFPAPCAPREPEQTAALREHYQPSTQHAKRRLCEAWRFHNLIDFKGHPGGKASIWFLPTQSFPTASNYCLLLALTQVVGRGLRCGYLHLNEGLLYSPVSVVHLETWSIIGCFAVQVLRQV